MTYLDKGKEHLSSATSIPYQLEHGNTSTMLLHSLSWQHLLLIEKGGELQNSSQFLSPALAVYKDFLCRGWALVFHYSWWLKSKGKETQKKEIFLCVQQYMELNCKYTDS